MNITRNQIEGLHEKITVEVSPEDYQKKVDETIAVYRKKASIPGFRKGKVPLGMIKKQYGKAILQDEATKAGADALEKYIDQEKLEILGWPVRIEDSQEEEVENDHFSLEFEICLKPEFQIDLTIDHEIIDYQIIQSEKELDELIEKDRLIHGEKVTVDEVDKHSEIKATFINEKLGIDSNQTFYFDQIRSEKNRELLIGKKVGELVTFKSKDLFTDDFDIQSIYDTAEDLENEFKKNEGEITDIELNITINDVETTELPLLEESFFKKVTNDDSVKTIEELKAYYKKESSKQSKTAVERYLSKEFQDLLVKNSDFVLPEAFFKKWLKLYYHVEHKVQYDESNLENDLRRFKYDLVEKQIKKDLSIEISDQEMKEAAVQSCKIVMKRFGMINPSEQEVLNMSQNMLESEHMRPSILEGIFAEKFVKILREKVDFETKEVDLATFFKMTAFAGDLESKSAGSANESAAKTEQKEEN